MLTDVLWGRGRHGLVCAVLLIPAAGVQAQGLRDPTVAPAAAGLLEPGTATQMPALSSGSMAVVVREGVRYLVLDTRLYTRGQAIGQARLERITETEVWLREDGVVRKVQIFNGIERRPAQAAVSVPRTPVTHRSAVVKP
jgi:hypothetical protein